MSSCPGMPSDHRTPRQRPAQMRLVPGHFFRQVGEHRQLIIGSEWPQNRAMAGSSGTTLVANYPTTPAWLKKWHGTVCVLLLESGRRELWRGRSAAGGSAPPGGSLRATPHEGSDVTLARWPAEQRKGVRTQYRANWPCTVSSLHGTRSSWDWREVCAPLVVMAFIIGAYLYFTG